MDTSELISGQCYCGNLKYQSTSAILNAGFCHCSDCQKLTGGTSWPFIVVKRKSITFSGTVKEVIRKGASGQDVYAGFCPECGTTLYGKPDVWPDIQTISASTLDNPSLFTPQMHAWTQDVSPWIALDESLRHFPQNPTE